MSSFYLQRPGVRIPEVLIEALPVSITAFLFHKNKHLKFQMQLSWELITLRQYTQLLERATRVYDQL